MTQGVNNRAVRYGMRAARGFRPTASRRSFFVYCMGRLNNFVRRILEMFEPETEQEAAQEAAEAQAQAQPAEAQQEAADAAPAQAPAPTLGPTSPPAAAQPKFRDIYAEGAQKFVDKIAELREAEAAVVEAKEAQSDLEAQAIAMAATITLRETAVTAKRQEAVETAEAQQALVATFITKQQGN